MAAKRNASGLSALPRPSLDNEELVRMKPLFENDRNYKAFEKRSDEKWELPLSDEKYWLVGDNLDWGIDYLSKILGQQLWREWGRISKRRSTTFIRFGRAGWIGVDKLLNLREG